MTAGRYLSIGTSGPGRYELTGGSLSAPTQQVGQGSTGSLVQTGGVDTVSDTLSVGANAGAVGTLELSGTGILTTSTMRVGANGSTGTVAISGGTLTATQGIEIYDGCLTISGGSVTTGSIEWGRSPAECDVTVTGGSLRVSPI